MYFKNTLSGRLNAWLITLVSLILGITSGIGYVISKDHVLTEARLQARDTVKESVFELETMLHGLVQSTNKLGFVLGYSSITPQKANKVLFDLIQSNQRLYGAAIALEPGYSIDSRGYASYAFRKDEAVKMLDLTAGRENPADYLSQSWYISAKETGQSVWSEPYFDELGGKVLMVTYSVPIFQSTSPLLYQEANQEFIGVVTADIELSRLSDFMNQIRVGESSYAMLVSDQGTLMSFPDPELMLSPITDLYPADDQSKGTAFTKQILGREAGVIKTRCFHSEEECLVGHTELASSGWSFVVVLEEDEFLAPIRDYLFRIIGIGLLTLALLLVVIHVVTKKVITPISSLSRLVGRIGEGDLSTVLPKVKSKDEVHTLVEAVNSMQNHLKQYIRDLEKETALSARLRGEMDAATQIQMAMLPGEGNFEFSGAAYEMFALLDPAKSVGGDLYFHYPVDDKKSYFVIGDVSDKGVAAALFMAKTITLLNQLVIQGKEPTGLLFELNNELEKNNDACMFVTLWCGILDHESLELRYASGGHMAPLMCSDQCLDSNETVGVFEEIPQENGMALGLMTDADFPENHLKLNPGDKLFLYTDGIDEARNSDDQFYGMDRLKTVLSEGIDKSPKSISQAVYGSVKTFAEGTSQSDDITVMAIKTSDSKVSVIAEQDTAQASSQLPVACSSIHMLFEFIETFWKEYALPEERLFDVKLCSEELLSNIVKYSGLTESDTVEVSLSSADGVLIVDIVDAGVPFNPFEEAPEPELGKPSDECQIGGLGVHLIKELAGTLSYERDQSSSVNKVKLTFDLL